MPSDHRSRSRVLGGFVLRSTLLHLLTYLVVGLLAYRLMGHRPWDGLAEPRDLQSHAVQFAILPAQLVRGFLLGLALLPLREHLLSRRVSGGLIIACLLLLIGSLAGSSGQCERWAYSAGYNLRLALAHLPENLLQSLMFGYVLLAWERRAGTARPKFGRR